MRGHMLFLVVWFALGGLCASMAFGTAMPLIVAVIVLGILGKVAAALDEE